MGDFTFEQGDNNSVILTVLRLSGTIPVFPTDYGIPKIRISHITAGVEVEDLAYTNMSQVPTSNRWFYNYPIPGAAPFTRYLVTFETVIEGITTYATEEFKVVPPITVTSGGNGTFPVTLTLKNSANLQPLAGVTINIYDAGNPSTNLASVLTDANGEATVYLNSGSYLAEFKKTGVISEVHNLTVDGVGNHELDGD